jgi:hypothetical protein
MKKDFGIFTIDSDFDSANIQEVEISRAPSPGEKMNDFSAYSILKLWTKPDGMENGCPTKNRTWFHFKIEFNEDAWSSGGWKEIISVEFRLMNLNRVQKLFTMGMRPVFRYCNENEWYTIPTQPVTEQYEGGLELRFTFVFQKNTKGSKLGKHSCIGSRLHPAPSGTYYFAYCIPYSYQNLKTYLQSLELKLASPFPATKDSKIPISTRMKAMLKDEDNSIYFERSILAKSVDGLDVEVLTITKWAGEKRIHEVPPKGTFTSASKIPLVFSGKRIVFLSARVHPGETIASHMLEGFLDFITSGDEIADQLRSMFVFKVVPMLNPDGVFRGNYRGDSFGVNLNRVFDNPDPFKHPTIWATKQYVAYLSSVYDLKWYLDFHGHANKLGSFILANWISDPARQIEMLKFAYYCQANNPNFDMSECDFAPKGMLPNHKQNSSTPNSIERTKEGTSRVAMYKTTGATHCYTFEANYHGTRPRLPTWTNSSVPLHNSKVSGDETRFSLQDMKMMGRAIGLSIYDMEISKSPDPMRKTKRVNSNNVDGWAAEKLKRIYTANNIEVDFSIYPFK